MDFSIAEDARRLYALRLHASVRLGNDKNNIRGKAADIMPCSFVLIHKWSQRDGARIFARMKEGARFVSVILTLPMLCHSRAYFRRVRHDAEIRQDSLNEPCNIAPRNARILKHKLCAPRARCVRKRDVFHYRMCILHCAVTRSRVIPRDHS
jgi:hypothetical protein